MPLLQSRLWASYDLFRAQQFLLEMEACDRLPRNQVIWQGNLLWLDGRFDEAMARWQQLPDKDLLVYARTLLLKGEQGVSFSLLEILNQRASVKSVVAANGPFFSSLAELYRYAGQEKLALSYQLLAWQTGQQGYDQAFYLGRSLANSGQCAEAVDVLTIGHRQKPNSFRPLLDFNYYITWGSCYALLGQTGQAQARYEEARGVLARAASLLSAETLQQQTLRLSRLELELQK